MNIQYVSYTTTNKNEAVKARTKVNKNKSLYYKENCSWEELKQLILNGCTIARVGTKTNYIAIDIDDSEVTHEEMKAWANAYGSDKVLWTKSISGKQYKHHVYFNVAEFDESEIKNVTRDCFNIIANAFGGKKIELDKNAWSYWQCMYNPASKDGIFILDGSIQLDHWTCKYQEPVPYINALNDENTYDAEDIDTEDKELEEYLANSGSYYATIPNNADHYKMLLKNSGISMEYYKTMPWEALKYCSVTRGYRHNTILKVADVVVKNMIINNFFGLNYTLDDAMNTIKDYIKYHFEDGNTFISKESTSITNAVNAKYNEYKQKYNESTAEYDYEALVEALGEGSHRFGIKSFADKFIQDHHFDNIDDACLAIVDCWNNYPEEYDTVYYNKQITMVRHQIKKYFENKKNITIEKDYDELNRVYELTKDVQLFDDMPVEPMSFEEFCSKSTAGDKILFTDESVTVERKERKQHKQRKCKYDCSGMSVEEFNTYCKENNIDRSVKSRLKKKFNIH